MVLETSGVLHKILLFLDEVSSYRLKQFLSNWIPVGEILQLFTSTFYIKVEISLLLPIHLSQKIFLTLSQVATFLLMYLNLKSIQHRFISYLYVSSATFSLLLYKVTILLSIFSRNGVQSPEFLAIFPLVNTLLRPLDQVWTLC